MEKVSIIMPCYNDGVYIEESIKCVMSQTYKDIELIIINDGSTDKYTNELLNTKKWKNTTVLNSNQIRPAAARNLGIESATGTYILPLDSDDLIEPEYIEKAVNILRNNKHVGVVYCYADLFGEAHGRWDLPNYSLEKMLLDNVVFVTALFYKEDWKIVGGFNTEMKNGMEDYDFWLSLLEIGREVYQIEEVLFHYRIKKLSRTTQFQSDMQIVVDTYKDIYKNHPKLYEKYKDLYAQILREELIHQIFINRTLTASIGCVKRLAKFPMLKKLLKWIINKFINKGENKK